ncbi:MAG: Rho termination factor [Phycisphaerae bacterium]|nr:Rho termination factor [Phycisphaerae bacterium]|tara:strand:+ start:845 stop:1093 length:249 start_codon:yes stop_codon:yes gene_type:complete
MPERRMNSIKNKAQYEKLRKAGMSKGKAARIANSKGASRRGGRSPSYEDMTKDEVYQRARKIGIDGRSSMTKGELIRAIRDR